MDTDMQNLPEKKTKHYSQASKRLVRALVGSFVSLFISMFAFSALTFAYFNDTSTAGNNTIVAGSIDMSLVEVDSNGNFEWTAQPVKISPASSFRYGSVGAENKGSIPIYVRIKVEKTILYAEHEISPGWEELIDCNFMANDHELPEEKRDLWIYHEGYYYYKLSLAPGEQTTSLFDTVTFAPDIGNEFENSSIQFRLICQSVQSSGNSSSPIYARGWPTDAGSSEEGGRT